MTVPTVPISKASDHPRFAAGADQATAAPPTKKIDTDAARGRIAAARTADKASDKPPTRRTRAKDDAPPAPIPAYRSGMYAKPIELVYDQGGNLLSYVAYPVGIATRQQAAACGSAWDKVAAQNPTVRKWLSKMTATGAWGELFAAHLPIFMTAMMVFGPDSFKERMGASVVESMDKMTEETAQ